MVKAPAVDAATLLEPYRRAIAKHHGQITSL
jgi:hypothetical protein